MDVLESVRENFVSINRAAGEFLVGLKFRWRQRLIRGDCATPVSKDFL